VDVKQLCDREEALTTHLKRTCPIYCHAVAVVAYWVALTVESEAHDSDNAWLVFQEQVQGFRVKIKEIMNNERN
jgi:hypothetical protein